jgi:hypothetical protein
MTANLAVSVRARLFNVAQTQGSDFNQVLVRCALERLLYRLSLSVHRAIARGSCAATYQAVAGYEPDGLRLQAVAHRLRRFAT